MGGAIELSDVHEIVLEANDGSLVVINVATYRGMLASVTDYRKRKEKMAKDDKIPIVG